jgi:dynein heavy chain
MAAAYRSEQRRLLSFIRMSDFMMCDTLHTVLVESVWEVLDSVRPALTVGVPAGGASGSSRPGSAVFNPAKRSLQTMHTLLNGSRRQRQSAALAGMQLAPVTAAQQQAAAAAAAAEGGSAVQRTPVFEMQVLLTQSLEDLAFQPEPEQFQVGCSCSVCLQCVVK